MHPLGQVYVWFVCVCVYQFLPKAKRCFNSTTSHAQVCEGLHHVAAFATSTTFSGEKEQNHCLRTAMQGELHPIYLCWGQFCAVYSAGKNMKIYVRYALDVAVSKDESHGSIYYPEGRKGKASGHPNLEMYSPQTRRPVFASRLPEQPNDYRINDTITPEAKRQVEYDEVIALRFVLSNFVILACRKGRSEQWEDSSACRS